MNANWNLLNLVFAGSPMIAALTSVMVGLARAYALNFAYQIYTARIQPTTGEREAAQ